MAVRIKPENLQEKICRVGFDEAIADGRDWIGKSEGVVVLIDRRDADVLQNAVIDYRDNHNQFRF